MGNLMELLVQKGKVGGGFQYLGDFYGLTTFVVPLVIENTLCWWFREIYWCGGLLWLVDRSTLGFYGWVYIKLESWVKVGKGILWNCYLTIRSETLDYEWGNH